MTKFYLKSILLCLFSLAGIAQAFAHDIEVANADGVTIYYNYINDNTELEVTYRGGAFFLYPDRYSGSVVIPETVAYDGKTYSVTSIGRYTFSGCIGLTSLSIGNNVTNIGLYAFNDCSGLTSVAIGNSVTEIGTEAFEGCSGLTSVSIGNSVTNIGSWAFMDCSGLTSLSIPNSVTEIGTEAFKGCSGLTSVTFGNGLTSIGPEAFRNCSGLTSVSIPNSVTGIGYRAFAACTGLTSVAIGNSVTNIGFYAFLDCSSLEKVIVSDLAAWCRISFETSDSNPLNCAHHLYSDENTEIIDLIIPGAVTEIGSYAFYGCSGLASVTIPNSVTNIGSCAFIGCSGLTSVTIPNSVTEIGRGAFAMCTGLTSIVSLIIEPSDIDSLSFAASDYGDDTAYSIYSNAILYVPEGTANKYRAREGWNKFTNIVEGLPSSITLTDKEASDATETGRYDINGKRIATPQRGINVVKMSDGTVKKVLVK